MGSFVFGIIAVVAGIVLLLAPELVRSRALGRAAAMLCFVIAVLMVALSTAIYVDDDRGGIVVRKFGPDLPPNRVVAANGEKGPQAEVLGPGWHFGYWPWLFDLTLVETITIDQGNVGVVSALDGKPLPNGEVYAEAWDSSDDMLDGRKFLAEGKGFRGPQLSVLNPGRYRFNPRLFSIVAKPALVVHVGEVAVVKANAGMHFVKPEGDAVEIINGVPLVPKNYQGIWNEALLPGAYNMHPDAYQIVTVQVTKRVYTYQDAKWAIKVRSKDGFTFPVDVRVSVEVSAADAPKLVAILADPDKLEKDDQEDEQLPRLEAKVVLPLIRTSFRDVAQGMNALQFVEERSRVEKEASDLMRTELAKYFLRTDGVFVANIELDHSDAGKQLLLTQTDRVVALNQQQMFGEKKKAEETRATFIKAQEEAEQQRKLAEATYQVLVAEQAAKAREAEAKGEASYISITAHAKTEAYTAMAGAIGPQGVTTLEMLKLVSEGKIQITPNVMVSSGGGANDALAGTILGNLVQPPAPAPAPQPAGKSR
jgi:regulator of protease activity HflC (stomatin/prohibitin superfamily)